MTTSKPSAPVRWSIFAVVILALAVGVWALTGRSDAADSSDGLPSDLSVEALKARAGEPGRLRETMRETMRRDDLTDEQRRKVAMNLRSIWRARMKERIDEYFDAADEDKNSILDKHIDSFLKRMKEWEAQRKKEEGAVDRESMRRLFASRSKQERKESSESRNPDETARTMKYFAAIRDRATDRGIQLPRGPRAAARGRRR